MRGAIRILSLVLAWSTVAHGGLSFENRVIQMKAPASAKEVEAAFPFTNRGEIPVTIRKVRTSCGCTTARLEKEVYAPGESGTITAQFRFGGRKGMQRKQITVVTDDPEEPTVELGLAVNIAERLRVRPTVLFWKEREPLKPKEVTVETEDGYRIESLELDVKGKNVKAVARRKSGGATLAVTPLASGRAVVRLKINAGRPDAETRLIHVHVP